MYAKKIPVKNGKDRLIKIAEGYSVKGKKKDRYYEDLGLLSELEKEHPDVNEFIKERIAFHLSEKEKLKSNTYSITIDYSTPIDKNDSFNLTKNGSLLFLNRIWNDLTLEGFFNKWKSYNNKKIQYSMNDAMRLMCFSRIINPGSKLSDSQRIHDYIEDFDLNIYNIYDSLDEIEDFSSKLTKKLSKSCEALFPGKGDTIYYDCSNFYFEIQDADEDGIRKYGIEKNHRPDPIIEYGLLYHGNGDPIGRRCFPGNDTEVESLVPLLKESGDEATLGKIICADAGLNSANNKNAIHETGRNYIFVQSLKGTKISAEIRTEMIDGTNMTYYGKLDSKGRQKAYKSRWIQRENGLMERLIVKYDPASYDFVMETIKKRIEHAKKIIESPSRLSLSKCSDGKEYIKKIVFNKEGEIIKEKSQLVLSQEKIDKEKELAGYYAMVTDIPSNKESDWEYRQELTKNGLLCHPLDDIEIIKICGKRVEIEDCFRMMKTSMSARPIFVRKESHIKAHMFTVYVALTLLCILKRKYLTSSSTESILHSLRSYKLGIEDESTYKTLYWDENIESLSKSMNLNLGYKYIENKAVRGLISTSKKR